MKKHIVGIVGFAFLLAAASAHAQITETIQAKVPFPFVAAGKAWPPADYRLKIAPTGLITLSTANVTPAFVMSNTNEHPGMEGGKSYLQFEHYGDNWVLREVTYDGTEQLLHQSKVERELAQVKPSGHQTLMASNISGY